MMLNVGIIGAGAIAHKMAQTLSMMDGVCTYAVASRELLRAQEFAARWSVKRAYGSYEALVRDPKVNLVYIATPHSHHYMHAMMALNADKAVLCEKSFTADAQQAQALFDLARSRGLFIAEAAWSKCTPLFFKVQELLETGVIGRPMQMYASLCYDLRDKERILRRDLCGGALMDVGVYCLYFARMFFGGDVVQTMSNAVMGETGVDMFNSVCLRYADGKIANLQSSALTNCNREGLICGDKGYIVVENINCPEAVKVYRDYQLVETYYPEKDQLTGYEYEVRACKEALEKGWTETPLLSWSETMETMKQLDLIRSQWGLEW